MVSVAKIQQNGKLSRLQAFSDSFMPARAFPVIFNGKQIAHAKFSVVHVDSGKAILPAAPHMSFWMSRFALLEHNVEVECLPQDVFILGKRTAHLLNSFHFPQGEFSPLSDDFYPVSAGEQRSSISMPAQNSALWLGSRGGECRRGRSEAATYIVMPKKDVKNSTIYGKLGVEVSISFHAKIPVGALDIFLCIAHSKRRSYSASARLGGVAGELDKMFISFLQLAMSSCGLQSAESAKLPIFNYQLVFTSEPDMALFQNAPKGRIMLLQDEQTTMV